MTQVIYNRHPSVAAYMIRALWPSSGLKKRPTLLPISIIQKDFIFTERSCGSLFELCSISKSSELPIIFPQILGFRLIMRVVTDPGFPESIWKALQTRNEITQHAPLFIGDRVDLELNTKNLRFLEKGAEVDLHLMVRKNGQIVWESLTTFYYRGRFQNSTAKPLPPPEVQVNTSESFTLPSRGGMRFGQLSGDFNGIHLCAIYAKMQGFKTSFLHPHRVVGAMISKSQVKHKTYPQHLDLWFRGPVAYGAKVRLFQEQQSEAMNMALYSDEQRPSIVARWK